jgi:hypothetical protein
MLCVCVCVSVRVCVLCVCVCVPAGVRRVCVCVLALRCCFFLLCVHSPVFCLPFSSRLWRTQRVIRGADIASTPLKKVELNRVVREFAVEISSAFHNSVFHQQAGGAAKP